MKMERILSLKGKNKSVVVTVFCPEQHGQAYRCRYKVEGLGDGWERFAMGIDGVQALTLALQMIGAELYASAEWLDGTLNWEGDRDLGFPGSESAAQP